MVSTCLLLLALVPQTSEVRAAGVLTTETGSVELVRGTESRRARTRERLSVDDKLTVSSPGKAMLTVIATREVWRLDSGAKVSVGQSKLTSLAGPKPVLITKLAEVKRDPKGKRNIGLSGVLRGSARGIEPIGALRSGPVVLSWSSDAWVASAKVEMYTVDGLLVWSHDVNDATVTSLEIPSSVTTPGEWYQVQVLLSGVKGADGLSRRERRQTEIKLLSKDERSELEGAEASINTAFKEDTFTLGDTLGELYATFAMAIELKKSVSIGFKDKAESPEAYFRLGDLFLLAGFRPEAMVSYSRAWDLGNRDPELKEAIRLLSGGGQ